MQAISCFRAFIKKRSFMLNFAFSANFHFAPKASGLPLAYIRMDRETGFEPATQDVDFLRSNQLSYSPCKTI
jgi:hypothetical protein